VFVALDALSGKTIYEAPGLSLIGYPSTVPTIKGSFLVSQYSLEANMNYYLMDPRTQVAIAYPPSYEALAATPTTLFTIYADTNLDETVQAVDVTTGKLLWAATPKSGNISSIYVTGSSILVVQDNGAAALDARSGLAIWTHDFNEENTEVMFSAFSGEFLYLGVANPQDGEPVNGRFMALDSGTGATNWMVGLASAPWYPVVAHGIVFVAAAQQAIYALDAESGRTRWIYPIDGQPSHLVVG
jgi:outer membrane protein assembly factor BamB